jgi:hypothetical protein
MSEVLGYAAASQPNRRPAMPTAPPLPYSPELIARAKPPIVQPAAWLIIIWAVVMLLFGAVANSRGEGGPIDSFQLLANF